MILALDIGNSRIKACDAHGDVIECRAVGTRPFRSIDRYIEELGFRNGYEGVVVASVVDELNETFRMIARKVSGKEPVVVSHEADTGLRIALPHPDRIGADRIANAVGGHAVVNGPVVVIDIGTAATLTVVGKDAELVGGCILPGAAMMAAALHEKTSKLPKIEFAVPPSVIGRDTLGNIQAGLSFGLAGAIERLLDEIRKEIGYTISAVLTGGMSGSFRGLIRGVDVTDPLLTIRGLLAIYVRSVSRK